MTGLHNVLEKLRSGELFTAKDQLIHEQRLVSVLKSFHDELDVAVLGATGGAICCCRPMPTPRRVRR